MSDKNLELEQDIEDIAVNKDDSEGFQWSLGKAQDLKLPFLGQADVLMTLLNEYLSKQVGYVELRNKGEIDTNKAVELGQNDAMYYADIMIGNNPSYNYIEGWNDDGLANFLLESKPEIIPADGTPQEQVCAFFLDISSKIFSVLDNDSDDVTEEQKSFIDSTVRSSALLLLGVEPND